MLSDKATAELKTILEKEFGDNAKLFSDEDIKKLGLRLLKLTALVLKNKNKA